MQRNIQWANNRVSNVQREALHIARTIVGLLNVVRQNIRHTQKWGEGWTIIVTQKWEAASD